MRQNSELRIFSQMFRNVKITPLKNGADRNVKITPLQNEAERHKSSQMFRTVNNRTFEQWGRMAQVFRTTKHLFTKFPERENQTFKQWGTMGQSGT